MWTINVNRILDEWVYIRRIKSKVLGWGTDYKGAIPSPNVWRAAHPVAKRNWERKHSSAVDKIGVCRRCDAYSIILYVYHTRHAG